MTTSRNNLPNCSLTTHRPPSSLATLPAEQHDGYEHFDIKLPHQGIVTLKAPLDFETVRYYELNVIAVVSASRWLLLNFQ